MAERHLVIRGGTVVEASSSDPRAAAMEIIAGTPRAWRAHGAGVIR